MEEVVKPRKRLPCGAKSTLREDTPPWARPRIKNYRQSPLHSQSLFDEHSELEDESGPKNKNEKEDVESSGFENERSNNEEDKESESGDSPIQIPPPLL